MTRQVLGAVVLLIFAFLVLSRASEANALLNTLGGFAVTETRNLQGYGPGGTLNASPATRNLRQGMGFNDPGWGVGSGGFQNTGGGNGLGFGSFNLASLFNTGPSQTVDQFDWSTIVGGV